MTIVTCANCRAQVSDTLNRWCPGCKRLIPSSQYDVIWIEEAPETTPGSETVNLSGDSEWPAWPEGQDKPCGALSCPDPSADPH